VYKKLFKWIYINAEINFGVFLILNTKHLKNKYIKIFFNCCYG
jgi:hypothetical protein